jgi:hypothetical protein
MVQMRSAVPQVPNTTSPRTMIESISPAQSHVVELSSGPRNASLAFVCVCVCAGNTPQLWHAHLSASLSLRQQAEPSDAWLVVGRLFLACGAHDYYNIDPEMKLARAIEAASAQPLNLSFSALLLLPCIALASRWVLIRIVKLKVGRSL